MMFLLYVLALVVFEGLTWMRLSDSRARRKQWPRLKANLGLGVVAILLSSTEPLLRAELAAFLPWQVSPTVSLADASFAVQIMAYMLVSTFIGYWVHRASHYFPVLWRFHGVHHSDVTVSASTSLRHHPGEFVVAAPVFFFVFSVFNLTAESVLAGVFTLSLLSVFAHSGLRLPHVIERYGSRLLPVPALHHVHHERAWHESNHNFAQSFPLWDVLFRTYLPPPPRERVTVYGDEALGHLSAIGLFDSAFRRNTSN